MIEIELVKLRGVDGDCPEGISVKKEGFPLFRKFIKTALPAVGDRANWESPLHLLSQLAGTCKDVEGQFFHLVFVWRLAPLKFRSILRSNFDQDSDGRLHCEKFVPIEHMYLTASARLLRVFLKRRFEDSRPEIDRG